MGLSVQRGGSSLPAADFIINTLHGGWLVGGRRRDYMKTWLKLEAYLPFTRATHLFQLPGTTNSNILSSISGKERLNENLFAGVCDYVDSWDAGGICIFFPFKMMSQENEGNELKIDRKARCLTQGPIKYSMYHESEMFVNSVRYICSQLCIKCVQDELLSKQMSQQLQLHVNQNAAFPVTI